MGTVMSTYPATLRFELSKERDLAAIVDAARELGLPFEMAANTVAVQVRTPQEAYDFGACSALGLKRRRRRSHR
jgi:hypothetical protein